MKIEFLVIVLVGKPFNADWSVERFSLILKLIFCSYLFVSLLVFKNQLREIIDFLLNV